jgi:hypothetical protein
MDVVYVDGAGNVFTAPAAGRTAAINTLGGGASRNVRRPDLISGVDPFLNQDRTILNPAAFAIPKQGAFGNLRRNELHGPGFLQFDMILAKKFLITEAFNVEFRSEFFNIFNMTNFANPLGTLNNAICTSSVVAQAGEPYCMAIVNGVRTPVANVINPGQPFTSGAAGSSFGILNRTVERIVGLGTNRQIQFALRLNF